MQKILVLLFALSLGACKQETKTETTEPKTAQRINTAKNYHFNVRYDGGKSEGNDPLISAIEGDENFKTKNREIEGFVENVNLKPVSELPSIVNLDSKITKSLVSFKDHKAYQDVSNYVLFLAVKGYFMRVGELDRTQKVVLGKYLDILVSQKNMELTELTWSLEQMKGVWEASKIRQTAQTIITQYDNWAVNRQNIEQVAESKELDSKAKEFFEDMKANFQRDDAARILLVQLSNFQ
jgi:hypothetical protein